MLDQYVTPDNTEPARLTWRNRFTSFCDRIADDNMRHQLYKNAARFVRKLGAYRGPLLFAGLLTLIYMYAPRDRPSPPFPDTGANVYWLLEWLTANAYTAGTMASTLSYLLSVIAFSVAAPMILIAVIATQLGLAEAYERWGYRIGRHRYLLVIATVSMLVFPMYTRWSPITITGTALAIIFLVSATERDRRGSALPHLRIPPMPVGSAVIGRAGVGKTRPARTGLAKIAPPPWGRRSISTRYPQAPENVVFHRTDW